MKFRKLTFKEIVLGLILIALGYLYIRMDQFFIPEKFRFYAFLIFVFAEFLGYFIIVHADKPIRLSNTLAVFVGVIAAAMIIVQHVMITNDFSVKVIFIFISSVLLPYLAGLTYTIFFTRSKKQ